MPSSRWAGSPAGSSPTEPKPNAPFQPAEQLGSVNAAATQLSNTCPSLRKRLPATAWHAHSQPRAIRQRAIAAHQRTGQPATPPLDPVFVALNPGALPARERVPPELYRWVRRDEEYAALGANVVVELNTKPSPPATTRAWAIIRRVERAQRHSNDPQGRGQRRRADRSTCSDGTSCSMGSAAPRWRTGYWRGIGERVPCGDRG